MNRVKDAFRHFALTTKDSGLFGIKGLRNPTDLKTFAQASLYRAQGLYTDLKREDIDPQQAILKLDELSDSLCRVVDLAAFLRIAHPLPEMVDAAQSAHETLFEFMSELNTDRGLYEVVDKAIQSQKLNSEQLSVAKLLKHDFMKSGIQFNQQSIRNKFVNLSTDISICGQQFMASTVTQHEYQTELKLSHSELAGLKTLVPLIRQNFKINGSQQHLLQLVMSHSQLESVRKKAWLMMKQVPNSQVDILDKILNDRLELAQLAGYRTFADYELSDKMMKTPLNVGKFLSSLATRLKPKVRHELKAISAQKAPWDYAFQLHEFRKQQSKANTGLLGVKFDIENVFGAIRHLAQRLYNLDLQPASVSNDEVWSPDVEKLHVKENGELIGVIYLDIMSRHGKQPHPAHYTIQCSRLREDGSKQVPIIALVCDLKPSSRFGKVSVHFDEVQTVFHEMGHALHSMIGRTDLHNVAGTRCATDFVELPSILNEKFASNPYVLNLLSKNLDANAFLSQHAAQSRLTKNYETWYQLQLSYIDQYLHGEPYLKSKNSQKCANKTVELLNVFDAPYNECYTQQFATFGHLISYGATYYSYLLDRCLAEIVYKQLFSDPTEWERNGSKLKSDVLKWGGSKDPQDMLSHLLGRAFNPEELIPQ